MKNNSNNNNKQNISEFDDLELLLRYFKDENDDIRIAAAKALEKSIVVAITESQMLDLSKVVNAILILEEGLNDNNPQVKKLLMKL